MAEWFDRFAKEIWVPGDETRRREADFIRKLLRLRKGGRILDAPCGSGGIAIHFARRGMHVTGIDLTASLISRARRRFRKESLPGVIRVLDLRELDYEGEFHAAYNWLGSFGYFSEAENADVLRRLVRALRPGGRLLIDQPNREYVLRHFRPLMTRGNVTVRPRWRADTQRVEAAWSIRYEAGVRTFRSSMRLYSPGQFRELFRQAGLGAPAMYGSWEGEPYRRGSRRLVLVGTRSK